MKLYAVIDTNVLVSALLPWDSFPGAVLEQALVGSIVPLLSDEIMEEYEEVLRRKKSPFQEQDILTLTDGIRERGGFSIQRRWKKTFPTPRMLFSMLSLWKIERMTIHILLPGI